MKINYLFTFFAALLILNSCSGDDDTTTNVDPRTEDPIDEVTNVAPDSFDLISVANGNQNESLSPILMWQAAADQDGDSVTYDLFLDNASNPTTKIAENSTVTEWVPTEDLNREETYYWRVVAKDENDAETQSTSIFEFTTRGLASSANASVENAAFLARSEHTMVEFNDKLWVIGGTNGSLNLSDVWSSDDGLNWNLVAESPFGSIPKNQHTSLVYDNKLWVISGTFSDVWFSTDGLNWTRTTFEAEFGTREGHASVVFDGKMWVMGGRNTSFETLNDVWSSTDGVVWNLETDNAQFALSSEHTVVNFNDQLYLMGGSSINNFTPGYSNEVYTSSDGINWSQLLTTSVFEPRSGHSSVIYDNKIWVIGGWQVVTNQETTEQEITSFNDAWYSEDGIFWEKAAMSDGFEGRFDHATTVFDNKIFISGGFKLGPSANDRTYFSDIWTID